MFIGAKGGEQGRCSDQGCDRSQKDGSSAHLIVVFADVSLSNIVETIVW
jgi:hypothetical protein